MQQVKVSENNIGRIQEILRKTGKSETRVLFWQIPRSSGDKDISLKIGRYKKSNVFQLYKETPESEVTLNQEELDKLINFISINYSAIKSGVNNFISISDEDIKKFFLKNKDKIDWSLLSQLDNEKLKNIESLVSIKSLEAVLKIWNENKLNTNEEFWQKTLQDNSWILSQVFSCPFIKIGQKFYCGGKEDDDKGGVKGDLLYKNNITNNLAFVEIKTPVKCIIGSQYRGIEEGKDNFVYSMDSELTGGINQVLNQRKVYIENHGDNNGKFLHNPKCVLVIGNTDDMDEDKKKSFELFRSFSKEVEIISFNELFGRIEMFIKLLKE